MSHDFLEQYDLLPPLLRLLRESGDGPTLRHATACVVNVLAERYKVGKLIQSGVVPALRALAVHPDPRVQQQVARALAALAAAGGGCEEWLVHDGAAAALSALGRSANPRTARYAAAGLVNLSTVLQATAAEAAARLALRAAVAAAAAVTDLLQFGGTVVLNLSVLPNVRIHLDREAAATCVMLLRRIQGEYFGDATAVDVPDAHAACLTAILNLLPVKQCRYEFVASGVLAEAVRLATAPDTDPVVRSRCITVLAELTVYRDATQPLLAAGAVDVLSVQLDTPFPLAAASAAAAPALAADPRAQLSLLRPPVLRRVVAAVAVRPPGDTMRRHALRLLARLAAEAKAAAAVLRAVDLPAALAAPLPAGAPALDAALQAALYVNLSGHDATASGLLSCAETVPQLVRMTKAHDAAVKAACLAALLNLARSDAAHRPLLDGGIMDAIHAGANDDAEKCGNRIAWLCASILYFMSLNKEAVAGVLEAGGMALLSQLCALHCDQTREACAAGLCNMLAVHPVADDHSLSALLRMHQHTGTANGRRPLRVLCCAKAFASLSLVAKGRAFLGASAAVLPCLIRMMRARTDEAALVQQHCAAAVCNVTSVFLQRQRIEALVQDRIIQDLVALTLLRANDVETKRSLAKALFNLLAREDTRALVLRQDAAFALLRLTRLGDPELNAVCVQALHNLTCHPAAAHESHLLKLEAERALLAQCVFPNGGQEVRRQCASALARLSCSDAPLAALEAGGAAAAAAVVLALRAMAAAGDAMTAEHGAAVLFNATRRPVLAAALAANGAVSALRQMFGMGPAVVKTLCVGALANLTAGSNAGGDSGASATAVGDGWAVLTDVMCAGHMSPAARHDATAAVTALVGAHRPARAAAVATGVTAALCTVLKSFHDEDHKLLVAKALRDMCAPGGGTAVAAVRARMLADGAMAALVRLAKAEHTDIKLDVSAALCRLSVSPALAPSLADGGAVEAAYWLTLEDLLATTPSVFLRVAAALRNLSRSDAALRRMLDDGDRLCKALRQLAAFDHAGVRAHVAATLLRLTAFKPAHHIVGKGGLVPVIFALMDQGSADVREACGVCLNQLPPYMAQPDERTIRAIVAMMELGDGADALIAAEAPAADPPPHDLKGW
ncbi:unnamed protein product, partial [Phaeothamnion confervicola]